jgi:cell division protein FtsB
MAASATTRPAGRARVRPARRRSGGGTRAGVGGIRWDRVARILLLLVLAGILLSYVGPATDYLRAWQLSKDTRAELRTLESDNARLRARTERLRDLETVELEARKSGMARPGERAYVIRGLPKDP